MLAFSISFQFFINYTSYIPYLFPSFLKVSKIKEIDFLKINGSLTNLSWKFVSLNQLRFSRNFCTRLEEDAKHRCFLDFLDDLKNYEKSGVPPGAGTDSDNGFDLARMDRLMERLGNPHHKFKAVHIAGTKGKGSTASFLSNILRAEGYSVGCYTSPHIQTIRERMTLGKMGEPVATSQLNSLFQKYKNVLDYALEFERGHLSHFEVLTAMAFTLFAEENVDIAVIEAGLGGARDATNIIHSSELALSIITTIGEEHLDPLGGSLENIALAKAGIIKNGRPLVLGGPFLPHIERILRDKASSMSSHVISPLDASNTSRSRGVKFFNGKPCMYCDFIIHTDKCMSVELHDVKLSMLGSHQLQNAMTANSAAVCLRNQGWKISDDSIRAGLEHTSMVGRGQVLTPNQTNALGLLESSVLLDGAHTKDSAKALVDIVEMAFPKARVALVVAMASDKDHLAFAKQLLSVLGQQIEAVFLTEVDIGGGKSRIASASILQTVWIQASQELGINTVCEYLKIQNHSCKHKTLIVTDRSILSSMRAADQVLKDTDKCNSNSVVVVTGSLHAVSSVLRSLNA